VIFGGVLLMTLVSRLGKREPLRKWIAGKPVALCACLCGLLLLIVLFGAYGIGYDASQFIYKQY